ncbi:unnamed protein product, partial [Linum tenue]
RGGRKFKYFHFPASREDEKQSAPRRTLPSPLDLTSLVVVGRVYGNMESAIPGMESVVASVSGYHGSERFKLIKLISQAGASYVGSMSKTTTHLVCWKFEGEKHNLAKKFGVKIVNHQWIEDCIKQGQLVPERPYMLRSGKEVGPLSSEVPISDKLPSNQNPVVLSNISNTWEGFGRQGSRRDSEDPALVCCTDSVFLNRDLFSEGGTSKGTSSNSKQQNRSSSRKRCQDPSMVLSLFEFENPSSSSSPDSRRGKRMAPEHEELQTRYKRRSLNIKMNSSDDTGATDFAEPSHKGRIRPKRNVSISKRNMETIILDSDEDSSPVESHGGTSNSFPESPTPSGRPSKLDTPEHSNVTINDVDELPPSTRPEPSVELSCVICWTEFSSTRGILPCGHRFCYSCIESWARHMDSVRKVSKCPLCKANFASIRKLEDADCSDQKIYSQTIPDAAVLAIGGFRQRCGGAIPLDSSTDDQGFRAESFQRWGCTKCRNWEPEELLVHCRVCEVRVIHSYCLDPYVSPWTCRHCTELQSLLRRSY